jgi:Zn-dependent protease
MEIKAGGVPLVLRRSLIGICAVIFVDSLLFHLRRDAPGTILEGAFVFIIYPVTGAALLMGNVTLHELSHVKAARWAGVDVKEVSLSFLGGVTRLEDGAMDASSPRERGVICAAGLAVDALSILAAALLFLASGGSGPLGSLSLYSFSILARLFLLNAAPVAITDGGRIIEAILEKAGAPQRAVRFALLGLGLGVTLPFALEIPVLPQPASPPVVAELFSTISAEALGSIGFFTLLMAAFWGVLGVLAAGSEGRGGVPSAAWGDQEGAPGQPAR